MSDHIAARASPGITREEAMAKHAALAVAKIDSIQHIIFSSTRLQGTFASRYQRPVTIAV